MLFLDSRSRVRSSVPVPGSMMGVVEERLMDEVSEEREVVFREREEFRESDEWVRVRELCFKEERSVSGEALDVWGD